MDYLNAKYADPATSELLDMASLVDPRFRAKCTSQVKGLELKLKAVWEAESLLADHGGCQPDPAVLEPADQEAAMPPTAEKKSPASFCKQSTAISTTLTQREVILNEP